MRFLWALFHFLGSLTTGERVSGSDAGSWVFPPQSPSRNSVTSVGLRVIKTR